MTKLTQAPLFRLFKLGIDAKDAAEMKEIGENNLGKSIVQEEGTLAMYSTNKIDDNEKLVVVEVYKDDAAYQEHIAADHFKRFAAFAQTALTSREVISLDPQLLLDKEPPLRVMDENDYAVRLAHVVVKEGTVEDFKSIVLAEMKESMAVESGVIAMYCGQEVENINSLYFFEVYENEAAYEFHRETPHFKKYIEETQTIVEEKELTVLSGEQMVNKGNLVYIK